MNNSEVAKLFLELADLIDLAGELPFKGASYRKVAQGLMALDEPFGEIVRQMKYEKIPGAGKTIKEKLVSLAMTGKLPALEKWRQHDIARFYYAIAKYGLKPRPLGMLIRKYSANDLLDLTSKLSESGVDSLTGQLCETAERLLEQSMGGKNGGT